VTVLYENFVYLQSFLSGAFLSRFISTVTARPPPHSHVPRHFCAILLIWTGFMSEIEDTKYLNTNDHVFKSTKFEGRFPDIKPTKPEDACAEIVLIEGTHMKLQAEVRRRSLSRANPRRYVALFSCARSDICVLCFGFCVCLFLCVAGEDAGCPGARDDPEAAAGPQRQRQPAPGAQVNAGRRRGEDVRVVRVSGVRRGA